MGKIEILNQIKERILQAECGSVFVAADFADVAENAKIATSLSRLESEKLIRRVMRGVYEKPEYSKLLGEYIAPSPDKVAHAIARNFGWTIIPCGDTALNMLGLSTQVPSIWLYVSDGTYKLYSYDNITIRFKKITNKEISKLSYKSALTVQALKAIGKDNIGDDILSKLSKVLTTTEKDKLLEEAKYVTSWIYDDIKIICAMR